MNKRNVIVGIVVIALIGFFAWRFIRPMNIFVVSENFERPVSTANIPAPLHTLRAEECGACHRESYKEWRTTIHSQAWTDPYFQVDWKFEGSPQVCKNCHIPLDRQQEHRVLGFRDTEKLDPILEPNPEYDPRLQHEGVTCTACHLREGKILGVFGDTNAPHPVKKLDDPNRICVQCHVVEGERWDTFFRFPPCGTVAEIESTLAGVRGKHSGEATVMDIASLGCVGCHMPLVNRPLVAGGVVRPARQHLWRGGHDPAMVKKALTAELAEEIKSDNEKRLFTLTLTNTGAAHYLPTGTPDRHLTVQLRSLDQQARVIEEQTHTLKRHVMWRPFIIDLWDTRLPRWQPRRYQVEVSNKGKAVAVEAVVRYHLLDEKRRKRIGYENNAPISYEVYRKRLQLQRNNAGESE